MIEDFIASLEKWAANQSTVRGVVLVGSHARGTARPDSDIDIVIICADTAPYIQNSAWLSHFGEVKEVSPEDWGLVQSQRVQYKNGAEIEFGITTQEWCSAAEIGNGTGEVIGDGARIVYDPHKLLEELIAAVHLAGYPVSSK